MGNKIKIKIKHTHTIPKHILKKKKPSILIRVIKKNKNSPKESRERESTCNFCMRKYTD